MLLATGVLGACFQAFEDYEQLAPPVRPSGAVGLPPGAPPAEIFPLVPGSRFLYEARFGLGTGLFSGEADVSVVDAWLLGGRETAEVRTVSRYFNQVRRDRYVFVREGGRIGLFEKAPPDTITFFMPTRLALGDIWHVETGAGTGAAAVEARETVTVPAGRFNDCYRVRYVNEGAQTDMRLWLAPEVGLVQAEVRMRINVLPLVGTLRLQERQFPLGREVFPRPSEAV